MFATFFQKFKSLLGQKKFTEENIRDAVQQVREALLEADVSYSVVVNFIERVKEKSLGSLLINVPSPSFSAGNQFIKIIHSELVKLMGGEEAPLQLQNSPSTVLLCGLQGSGKTTTAAKLAYWLRKGNKKILVAACDLQRPAAVEQLRCLCQVAQVSCFSLSDESDPLQVARKAQDKARQEGFDILIVDTAGRLHVDFVLLDQLSQFRELLSPEEVLFVANSTTGQDAVKAALAFDEKDQVTGIVLTLLDGTSRAGAALSIREVTKKPLKFEGVGENIQDLRPFNPSSMADRILGMGDVINLSRKVEEECDEAELKQMEGKLKRSSFTYTDYLKQLRTMKRMGSFSSLLGMLPKAFSNELQSVNMDQSAQEMKMMESIILSMTPSEREEKVELTPSRMYRIAQGSGVGLVAVKRLVKKYKQAKRFSPQLLKQVSKGRFFGK